ncbi:hypothetical protein CY652_11560 [Burkholderia sp. WAC0059]|uniref:DUF3304 domain-containing protein n=1 Tax=Burkholderia sp. WAC0059 TaxID=2066022 RepID=UPI000C7F2196|nr:DUF3304 domain-containing protein [Burkholderia sp. WAC0059]PLZ02362.1 hypothetical protein CY652_11560 [Burkholderia sp. WAC0059]
MKKITILIVSIVLMVVSACATEQPRGYVDATAWSANYTEDYIHEFHIETASGRDTGLEGIQVGEFSKGGMGKHECCSLIPGVGQTIRIVWTVANTDDKAQWKTYGRDVVVTGTMPKPGYRLQSYLIVRFFPNHEVEAELLPGDGDLGPGNPRMDRLFFVGPRVMRHKGE